jgi:hypothetical protein
LTDNGWYNSTPRWPAHLSVTVVMLNDRHEVAFHYWTQSIWGDDLYTLMHETVHQGEALEAAAGRGLMEEWGATAELVAYLGTHTLNFTVHVEGDRLMEKAMPTFLARVKTAHEHKRSEADPRERSSQLVYLSIDEALRIMASQAKRFPDRPDLDESVALRWAKKYLATEPQ